MLLFHLLTRAYPYAAADIDGLRAAHADGSRAMLRDLRPDLPDELVRAVDRALEPDPARRFATAGEMERGLALALTPAPPVRLSSAWVIAAVRRWRRQSRCSLRFRAVVRPGPSVSIPSRFCQSLCPATWAPPWSD